MSRRAERSRAQIAPRFIREADAPGYLCLEVEEFDIQVRPYIDAIPVGSDEIAFDRMDLDRWADEYKQRHAPSAASTGQSKAQQSAPSTPVHVLRLPEVCKMTGLRRSWIYQLEAENRFPRRIKIGARAVGWIAEEVQRWLANRVERSRSNQSLA